MKKKSARILALTLALTSALALTGCGTEAGADDTTIRVGASPAPHAEVLEVIADNLEEEGYTLEIVEYNDYILPNTGVSEGDLDANYFQHISYLNNYNEENGTDLVSAGSIHYEPFALYAGKTASIDALTSGAQIAVPNDGTNEGRALKLLEAEGLITLDPDAGFLATKLDIVENPLNLDIVEMEAAQLPRVLTDVDMAVINGNYAIDAGLDLSDALAVEADDSEAASAYANVVAVANGNENSDKIKVLVAALQSDEVKQFMEETYGGAVVPLF